MASAWIYLLVAGACEVVWAIGLKYTDGFTRPLPTVATLLFMLCSFFFLSQAMKTIPLGTGYAIWTGIGAVGTTLFGIAVLGEPRDGLRLLCIFLIILGVLGLRFLSPT